jgi:ankyrin repeat protein
MIEVRGRYGHVGTFACNYQRLPEVFDRLIDELCTEEHPRPDIEHESVSATRSDGWSLGAQMSGLVSWVNVESPSTEKYQRDIPRAELHDLFMNLAAGNDSAIEACEWKERRELPPFQRNFWLYANHPQKTDLHKAAHLNDVDWATRLLRMKPNLDAQDEDGATPLHCAALAQNKEMCQFLIRAGANVNSVDLDGETPLDYAFNDSRVQEILRQNGGRSGNNSS